MQAVIAAGVRGDLRGMEKVLSGGNARAAALAEWAFRETVTRFAVDLAGLLQHFRALQGAHDVLCLDLVVAGKGMDAAAKRQLWKTAGCMQEVGGAIESGYFEYLAAMDSFCRRIGGISVKDALGFYLPGLNVDYPGSDGEPSPSLELSERSRRVVESMLSSWRVRMGGPASSAHR